MLRSWLLLAALLAAAPAAAQECVGVNTTCAGAIDFMLLMDGSGSLSSAQFATTQDFAKSLVQQFEVGDNLARFGVIQFAGSSPTLQLTLSGDPTDICTAIDNDSGLPSGATPMALAIDLAEEQFDKYARDAVPRVIFLLTDGDDTVSGSPAVLTAAEAAKNETTRIFALAIGDNIDLDTLGEAVSSPTDSYLFQVADVDDLFDVISVLVNEACLFVSSLSPKGDCLEGGRTVTVRGSGFVDAGLQCRFGNSSADPLVDAKYVSLNEIQCVAPPTERSGFVEVDVTLDGVTFSSSSGTFNYGTCSDAGSLAWLYGLLFALALLFMALAQYYLKYKVTEVEYVETEVLTPKPDQPLLAEDPVTSNQNYLWAGVGAQAMRPLNVQWGQYGAPEMMVTRRLSAHQKEVQRTRNWLKIGTVVFGVVAFIMFVTLIATAASD